MSTQPTNLDPQDRVCCPDDFCTGILNEKGTCGTCDRTYSQHARASLAGAPGSADQPAVPTVDPDSSAADNADARVSASDQSDDPHDSDDEESSDDPDESHPTGDPDAPDPTERVLCSDDMCTGIIGSQGACGTCGAAPTSQ